jgi:hypothetical protein
MPQLWMLLEFIVRLTSLALTWVDEQIEKILR